MTVKESLEAFFSALPVIFEPTAVVSEAGCAAINLCKRDAKSRIVRS
jgi:hypothetical protein